MTDDRTEDRSVEPDLAEEGPLAQCGCHRVLTTADLDPVRPKGRHGHD